MEWRSYGILQSGDTKTHGGGAKKKWGKQVTKGKKGLLQLMGHVTAGEEGELPFTYSLGYMLSRKD